MTNVEILDILNLNKFILNGLIEEQGMIEIEQGTNDILLESNSEGYKISKDPTMKNFYKKLKREQQEFNRLSITVQRLIIKYRNMVN